MATLPLSTWPQEAIRLPAPIVAPHVSNDDEPARLSALEWSIVAMGERDSIASLREPSRFVSALGGLFGVRRANRLANDRLEALRRMSVLVWRHRWNVPKSELNAFLKAGFSIAQYELVQASIAEARAQHGRKTAR